MSLNRKTKIISVVNQKGGVGKTTTVMNLATALAVVGQKILVCDLDPQGNASTGLGFHQDTRKYGMYEILTSKQNTEDVIMSSNIKGLDVITSSVDLAAAEIELSGDNTILKNNLKSIYGKYDMIFIDCPPSLGMLTINALCASNSILIPVQCEFFALEGLSHLMKTYEMIVSNKDNGNTELELNGVLLTMYDKRNNLTQEVEREVRKVFDKAVYRTVIPRNIKISEAPSYGVPVMMYDIESSGSKAYIALAQEFIQRNGIIIS